MKQAFLGLTIAALIPAAPSAVAEEAAVTGVTAEDVLNLRAEPRANAALVGALAPTASGIEILKRTEGWAFVRFGQQSGWASARYLRPAMTFADGKPPLPLHCVGTEPFWSLTLDGETAVYNTPEGNGPAAPSGPFEQSRNSTIVWRVQPHEGPIARAVIEGRHACSDNMSDRVYSFRIHAETRDGQLLSGCCEAK